MAESKRTDIACFNITFNMPPEVITAYYEGMAKVELAKHGHPPMSIPTSKSSSNDWISSLSWLIPLVMPLVADKIGPLMGMGSSASEMGLGSSESSSSNSSSSLRVPRASRVKKAESGVEMKEAELGKIGSSMSKVYSSTAIAVANEITDSLNKGEESIIAALTNPDAQVASSNDKESKKEVAKEVTKESEASTSTSEEKPSALEFDFSSLGGGGGFADMMKMIGPMVKELSSAFEAPKASEPKAVKAEGETSSDVDPIAEKIVEKVPFDE